MNKIVLVIVGVVLALGTFLYINKSTLDQNDLAKDQEISTDEESSDSANIIKENNNTKMRQPEVTIDQSKEYIATFKTAEGDIKIELDVKNTPITSNNFVYLANEGFYNGTIFHRVMKDFMIQGGDPTGTGAGGPGYRFDDEEAGLRSEYLRGTVAMANAGPNTNGSQFFIMHKDYPLPPNYVIFGEVIEGMDVVDKIATAPVEQNSASPNSEMSKPVSPVAIESVEITMN